MVYVCICAHVCAGAHTHACMYRGQREEDARYPSTLCKFLESGSLTEPGAWALFPVSPLPHSIGATVMYMPMQIFFTWVQQAL